MIAQSPPVTDADWLRLLDEDTVTAARGRGEARLRDMGSDQLAYLRRMCKTDLFFLATGPLEYDLLSENLHGDYCHWLEARRSSQYRLLLWPRNHFKTTLNTICDSIQMALPGGDNLPYPYNLGPNIKLLLAHEKRDSASRFLFEITAAFRSKDLMVALFPELIPQPRVQRINKYELELPRQESHKEPTFDTIGAGGAAQGNHYHHLKLDDIIGEEARDSDTVMARAINWFDNVNSLLTRPRFDGWDLNGTFWADADVYGRAIEVYGINKAISHIGAITQSEINELPDGVLAANWRGILENGEPIFPEENPMEFILRLQKNPVVYAAQYANNPLAAGITEFQEGWLGTYEVRGPWLYVFSGTESWRVNVWDLDRVVLIDPSMGETKAADESGICVVGTDEKGRVYLLETIKKRLTPPLLIDEMFRLYTRWKPRVMSVEAVNFSGTYRYWFQERAKRMKIFPSIYDYKVGKKSKIGRIRGLANLFASRRFYISPEMYDFRDEYKRFPIGKSKHLLDALAQGPEVWQTPVTQAEREERKARAAVGADNDHRDPDTGY